MRILTAVSQIPKADPEYNLANILAGFDEIPGVTMTT